MQRKLFVVQGQVQGVGFRPFVYSKAQEYKLTGFVENTNQGVCIEVQGSVTMLTDFEFALTHKLPVLAKITQYTAKEIPIKENEEKFSILRSEKSTSKQTVLISPDIAQCDDCKNEMLDKNNKRYLYPFINCTHCGPRFSITKSMPYDRMTTSMACFDLCPDCATEYTHPLDRRFHAQPTSCPTCGVKIWTDSGEEGNAAIKKTLAHIIEGKVIALKGLGGFHLVCDAYNESAIQKIRERKNRPHKPLAIMVGTIEKAHELAEISPTEEKALQSKERPIVICKRKKTLPNSLSPDTQSIGIMLPSTPLHELLFHANLYDTKNCDALVMTSGNIQGEPICLGNREAIQKLGEENEIADAFLFHNRDILVRVDDSVLFAHEKEDIPNSSTNYTFIRRARGYVPSPCTFNIKKNTEPILGLGADLKSTSCLTRGNEAFVGQHIGDIAHSANNIFLEESINHLTNILATEPKTIVCDAHPNSFTSLLAEEYATKYKSKIVKLQHHAAHAFALLADNAYEEPCLVMVLDGAGYGLDDTIWGGELLLIEPQKASWKRVGRFTPMLLIGGDMAVKEPWRMAESFTYPYNYTQERPYTQLAKNNIHALREIRAKNIGMQTSSCGRLFDAIGALLGCSAQITYEGQTAIQLEALQDFSENQLIPMSMDQQDSLLELNTKALFHTCMQLCDKENISKETYQKISRIFHLSLAQGLTDWGYTMGKKLGIETIGMSGGVFLNHTILQEVNKRLQNKKIYTLLHQNYSPSDASISLGQTYFAYLSQNVF